MIMNFELRFRIKMIKEQKRRWVKLIVVLTVLAGCQSANKQEWSSRQLVEAGNQTLTSLSMLENGQAMILSSLRGNSRIFATDDEGNSWKLVTNVGYGLHDIELVAGSLAVAVGNGAILRTEDFGTHWDSIDSSARVPLITVDFQNPKEGMAVGMDGTILQTSDGGESWIQRQSGSDSFLRDVKYITGEKAVAVGFDGTILYTDDNGVNWRSTSAPVQEDFNGVVFRDSKEGLIVGGNGIILYSRDGGSSWSPVESNTDQGLLAAILTSERAIAVGHGGTILSANDVSRTWNVLKSGTEQSLYDVAISSSGIPLIVGRQGILLTK